jgi:dihydrodipicolinate synthase/N-acetylneuraminate lyase
MSHKYFINGHIDSAMAILERFERLEAIRHVISNIVQIKQIVNRNEIEIIEKPVPVIRPIDRFSDQELLDELKKRLSRPGICPSA